MQLTELTIRRQASYESDAGQFKGKVQFTGEGGEIVTTLSPRAISQIFTIIKADVSETAKRSAKQTENACLNAADEPLLLEKTIIDGEAS